MIDIIRRAREILNDPNSWCQHAYFADTDGNVSNVNAASRFDIYGAIFKACVESTSIPVSVLMKVDTCCSLVKRFMPHRYIDSQRDYMPLERFNDDVNHAEIIALLDLIISSLDEPKNSSQKADIIV